MEKWWPGAPDRSQDCQNGRKIVSEATRGGKRWPFHTKMRPRVASEGANGGSRRPNERPRATQRGPKGYPEEVWGALLEEKGAQKLNFEASSVKMLIFRKSRFYLSKSTDFEGCAAPKSKRFIGNRAKLPKNVTFDQNWSKVGAETG